MERTVVQRVAGTLRPLRSLLVAVIVLPLGLFASAAWLNYRGAFDPADAEVARTTDAVHEHALKVFEINELVLDRLADRYGGLDEATLADAPKLRTYVKELAASARHITSAGFIFADGCIISSNLDLPPGSAHHHEFMTAPRKGKEMLIGGLETRNHRNELRFLIARRKSAAVRGADADLIFISVSPDYFKCYYSGAFGPRSAISVVRTDGAILARSPQLPTSFVLPPSTGFRRAIAGNPDHGNYSAPSALDGPTRIFSYRRLGDYPLYRSVSDTGSGMTPEVRAQAFDPFFTTKEVGKGSGLGLSQVYGFAKQSGRHVTVESEPGRGTCVRFYLPSVEAPTQRGDAARKPHPERRTGSILIVEDDEAALETVRSSLEGLGYRTIPARSAAEALDVLRRDEPIDLLFSDIVMPSGINGVALARWTRQLRQDIKVLLTSGYSPAAAKEPDDDGFAVLSKPYRQSERARVVASVLGERASSGVPS